MNYSELKNDKLQILGQLNSQKNQLLQQIRAIEEEMLMLNGEIRLINTLESESEETNN